MISIGHYNTLRVTRNVGFGSYLTDLEGTSEVLIPSRYLDHVPNIGEEIHVFVYRDSEDRPIATTERPYAVVGQFAYLQVKQQNAVGAFLDWGIAKDLLVPFREQKVKMKEGGIYLVYVYLDPVTNRVVASAKIEKFIGNTFPKLRPGDKVEALPYAHTEKGYKCVVDNLWHGMLYDNELYRPVELDIACEAYVKRVREDGKIDLSLKTTNEADRTNSLADEILAKLADAPGNSIAVGDRSTPDEVREAFGCSKKDFKRAAGHLYKAHKVEITDGSISLVR